MRKPQTNMDAAAPLRMPEKTGQAEFPITSKTPECLAVTGEQKLLITVTE